MKVVLLEDVRKVGKKGDVVNVSDGCSGLCYYRETELVAGKTI